MKKATGLLILLPLMLASCGKNHTNFNVFKEYIDGIEVSTEHPYYRVRGSLDFNNSLIEVDSTFNQNPTGDSYVPYARYNEGFYCEAAGDNVVPDEEDVVIYAMASRSYWLRMPLKLDRENFLQYLDDDSENPTCAHYAFTHLITAWMDESGAANPSSCYPYFDLLPNGGFVIGGDKVHTKFTIDNYPYYPDPVAHPEIFGPDVWDFDIRPRPSYDNVVDAKVDIRFEYDKDGWLVKEELTSIGYDYSVSSDIQVALYAEYTYKFSE